MDVHRATAAEVFGTPLSEVSAEQRRYAKTINFGLIYGMGAFGLASSLGIEKGAAQSYIERYFQRFAGVKRYMDETRARAAELGYVETVFGRRGCRAARCGGNGRRIELPDIRGGNGPRRAGAERQAINAPMQGTAADLIKLAMLAVQAELDAEHKRTAMVMQVHDELVFEVPDDELAWAKDAIPRLMAGVAQFSVPLLAEVGVGSNWDEAH
jgi:DNA polymerase I